MKTRKKLLAMFLALCMIGTMFTTLPVMVSAEIEDDFEYEVSGSEATITGYTGAGGKITIPSTLGGYPVTTIGSGAFYGCEKLTSVTIPDSVTIIGEKAFCNCKNLQSVTIPDSVTSIGEMAFCNCSKLANVIMGSGVTTIGNEAFYECTNLTSVTIPDSVTIIGEKAFWNCKNLQSVTIPDSVTSIGEYAFYHTGYYDNESNWENSVLYIGKYLIQAESSLFGSYSIKDGTLCIADYAFRYCRSLQSVTIPGSVTTIGDGVFVECYGLASIEVDSNNPNYSSQDGVLFNKYKTTLIQYPIGNTRTSYTIPNSVTTIGWDAFSSCSGLTSVTIGDSVTTIGTWAFGDCTALQSVTIGNSVTSIGDYAFCNCTALQSVTIGNSVTTIGEGAFCGCEKLTSVTVPGSVTNIGFRAFSYCTSLQSITIPDSVTNIGGEAFCYTEYFNNESNWENDVLYIGKHLIEAKDTLFGSYSIKDGTLCIADYAFFYCRSLQSVTIPDSVTTIGNYAFEYCTSLTSIEVASNNPNYSSQDGVLFDKNKTTLIQYPIGNTRTSYTIPNGVTTIGNKAFYCCKSLTSIAIPDSVTTIGDWAFYYCESLKSITIPDSVTTIGEDAFLACIGLQSVTIGNSVTTIGSYAFEYCTSLTDVYYFGTKEDWSKITIGSSNDPLIQATRHYVNQITVTGLTETVKLRAFCEDGTVAIGYYDDRDILIGAETLPVSATVTATPPEEGCGHAKVMWWKDADNMIPVCEARKVEK